MSKYDYIKFDGCVRWMDDATDRCRTMQVCIPLPPVVTDDTIIGLIPADEADDCQEEAPEGYSVPACKLIPYLTPFHEGYWSALQAVLKHGGGTSLVSAMLRSSQFTYAECLLQMQCSGADQDIFCPIFDTLFPDESSHGSNRVG